MTVTDAYEAYIRERKEREETDKIATLVIPQTDLASIWNVIAGVVDNPGEPLSAETKRKWESILRSIARAVQEAK